jgi:large subunit ribosomal protein L28
MAKCDICGKIVRTGMNVSHSHIRTKRQWKPNLQTVHAVVDGTPKKVTACTRCLRSGKVQRTN